MEAKTIVVLVDGMRPDKIAKCGNPFLVSLREKSSWSPDAETVVPSITLPCHLSLFTGVSPDTHTVRNNTWHPFPQPLPGLFEAVHAAGKKTAMVFSWEQLRDVNRPGSLDRIIFERVDDGKKHDRASMRLEHKQTARVIRLLQSCEYDFIFFYYELADVVGHRDGWDSPEYLSCIADASRCIRRIYRNLPPEYQMFVIADHGGHDKDHDGSVPEDRRIPFYLTGPMIKQNHIVTGASILDVAPTVAELLHVPAPETWEGKSILSDCLR